MKSSLLAISIALSGVAFGQTALLDTKPGLWETTSVVHVAGMPSIDLSRVPPEARKNIEENMKKRQAPETQTTRSCMTKEKLEKDMFMNPQQVRASCKRTILTNTRSTIEVKVECSSDKFTTTGIFHVQALSRESVKGDFKTTGGPVNVESTFTSKWISDSCGDVK